MSVDGIWSVMDGHVASGRIPGYVAAVRIKGHTEARAGGRRALEADSEPMTDDTLFRIASLTKPIGGVLVLRLVEEGLIGLDDPIDRWLPEMADPRVLVTPDAPLDQTVAAERPITVRHLATMTAGWGAIFEPTPLQHAMIERGLYPGPLPPPLSGDEFVAALGELPLAFAPGEGWLYDTPLDVLGVLLARAAGAPLSALVADRITGPLSMTSTGFWTSDVARLATAYTPGPFGLEVLDPPEGRWAQEPPFEELSSGLVSTAPDVLGFLTAMADDGGGILSPESLALLTADALTARQRRDASLVLGPGRSWGIATGVDIEATEAWMAPGRWGWDGGTGTGGRVDPVRDTVGVVLTQRAMTSPLDGFDDVWAAIAAAA